MTKEDEEDFGISTKYWICNNVNVDGDVKIRGHCHILGKYRDSAQRDCNIKVESNCEVPIVFHNLKSYNSHQILKFNIKINVIQNGLEKYMSFSINNNSFIDSFQFLSSSLDSLVKILSKDNFKHLSQEFDSDVDLVEQKRFYLYENLSDSGKFQEELTSKENFYSSLAGKKIGDKEKKINILK